MHAPRTFASVFTSALLLSFPVAPYAQQQVVIHTGGGFSTGGGIVAGSNPIGPYTMTTKTTSVQKLANGVTITRETTSKRAIDSDGRTYNEQHFDRPMLVPGNFTAFSVFDPVNHTTMNWNSEVGVVTVSHLPDPATLQQTPPPPQPPIRIKVTSAPRPKPQIEDLGTQTILGLTAKGTRVTYTIPAGSEGNDQAFTVTTEQWVSTDLGINLLSITDDPRNGTTTDEVTDFQRGEPDPSLFQIPEGYTVQDINP